MLEHLNIAALVLFGVIFLLMYRLNTISRHKSMLVYVLIAVSIGLIFTDAWMQSNSEKENINHYKSQKVLKCYSGGGLYNSGETYKVSSQDGWKLYKGTFVKESLVLRANKCEVW